jgi:hypothetical protein
MTGVFVNAPGAGFVPTKGARGAETVIELLPKKEF